MAGQATNRRAVLGAVAGVLVGGVIGAVSGSTLFPREVVKEREVIRTETRIAERTVTQTAERTVTQPVMRPAASPGDFTWKESGKTNIVVVGAGPAGVQFSKSIVELMGDRVTVTILERNLSWVSGPAHVDFVAGVKKMEQVTMTLEKIPRPGIRIVNASVVQLRPEERTVYTNYGTTKYDVLVLAPGIDLATWEILGLSKERNLHAWDPVRAVMLREELAKITSGNVVFGVPAAPYKCPPAPYEVAMLSREFINEQGKGDRVKVTVLDSNSGPQPPPKASYFREHMTKLGIDYRPNFKIAEVNPETKEVISVDGEKVKYDVLSILPPNVAPSFVREAGLGTTYMDVDPTTFRSRRYDDVYGIGDVILSPYTRSMYVAMRSGRRLAELLAERLGVSRPEKTSVYNICWSYVNKRELTVIEVEWDDAGRTKTGFPRVGPPTAENFSRRQEWERASLLALYG
ncbi:MAG: NAD(P)/FAD-dependent oxidoreductase [Thaumarchaeota archaeon]|nr:NAD(P)/FAD-dependent oxidoreductase [Candidatus Calditenuaceae archaeon]MDW8041555.1 FAD/NAD(P)-binding oxidoreductase [Nitrososphaerota archaeon]